VAATAQQILDVFKRHGVTVIPAGPGTPFDPAVHQAVTQQPAKDVPPGAVVRGNPARLHGRREDLRCWTGHTLKPYPLPGRA